MGVSIDGGQPIFWGPYMEVPSFIFAACEGRLTFENSPV